MGMEFPLHCPDSEGARAASRGSASCRPARPAPHAPGSQRIPFGSSSPSSMLAHLTELGLLQTFRYLICKHLIKHCQ